MLENSNEAPVNWRMDQAESKVREFILGLDPDFVFFQELPGLVPYVETHDLILANTVSHSGNIATIVRKELMDDLDSVVVGKFAVMTTINSAGITLANVHLAPGSNGDHKRADMVKRLIRESTTSALAIVGDTNTRVSEEASFKSIGLSGERPPKATWNSKTNRFRKGGRKYTAFYSRYFHTEQLKVTNAEVLNAPIEESGKSFYLSDHFAISGKVT